MTESEKIKIIEEQITLAVLLPGIDLSYLPPEESVKLKRALLDVYRLSHARGFKSGAEHAMNSIASFMDPQSDASEIEKLKRWVSDRMPENWQEFKKSLRAIRVAFRRNSRPRRFPTEALSGNWAVRR